MSYTSKSGRRPNEYASKSSHSHLVKDPEIQSFLERCVFPKGADEANFSEVLKVNIKPTRNNPIENIIAIDGGYSEISARKEFPSATIAFFQFGALIFSIQDLESLENSPFIAPEDMEKLKKIERLKFSIPVKNIATEGQLSLTNSIRNELFQFFSKDMGDHDSLNQTLEWLIFEGYLGGNAEWVLSSCPICETRNILINKSTVSSFTFPCSACKKTLFLTDCFRLHEAIDDELGAGGILGYLVTTIEQVILAHFVRIIISKKASLLGQILFVKDGPLAFFGQTANFHKPFRALFSYLIKEHDLNLVGLEKSGPFVDHAAEIAERLNRGSALILDNNYIYKFIIPGNADPKNPYGRTTYYSNKVIYRTPSGGVYVASLPTTEILDNPKVSDFHNLEIILSNVSKLRCDMYDNSLVPIALVNKLVSLAAHPSSRILERFVKQAMS